MVTAEHDPQDRVDVHAWTSGRGGMLTPKVSADRRLGARPMPAGPHRAVRDDAATSGSRGTPPRVVRCYQSPPHPGRIGRSRRIT